MVALDPALIVTVYLLSMSPIAIQNAPANFAKFRNYYVHVFVATVLQVCINTWNAAEVGIRKISYE
jgi:hypothetical protein